MLTTMQLSRSVVVGLYAGVVGASHVQFLVYCLGGVQLVTTLYLFAKLAFSAYLSIFHAVLTLRTRDGGVHGGPLSESSFTVRGVYVQCYVDLGYTQGVLSCIFIPCCVFGAARFCRLPYVLFRL